MNKLLSLLSLVVLTTFHFQKNKNSFQQFLFKLRAKQICFLPKLNVMIEHFKHFCTCCVMNYLFFYLSANFL